MSRNNKSSGAPRKVIIRLLTCGSALLLATSVAFAQGGGGVGTGAGAMPPSGSQGAAGTPVLGNASNDDTAGLMAAAASATSRNLPLRSTRNYRITSNQTISAPSVFDAGASIVVDRGVKVTLTSKSIRAPNDAQIFRGAGTVVVQNAGEVWTS